MKITAVLPSYLGEYPGCAPNRKQQFVRAVDSFLSQTQSLRGHGWDSELVIVSDGCEDTITIVNRFYKTELAVGRIVLLKLPRHEVWDGAVRQAGVEAATGDLICYLDSDDFFSSDHLANIVACFTPAVDWVYFNSEFRLQELKNKPILLDVQLDEDHIGTSNIAHRRGLNASWAGWIGAKENWHFIKQLIERYPKCKKIGGASYVITHAKVTKITKVI
jgi:glycosyltransferase involved in cell wall biosynthesis